MIRSVAPFADVAAGRRQQPGAVVQLHREGLASWRRQFSATLPTAIAAPGIRSSAPTPPQSPAPPPPSHRSSACALAEAVGHVHRDVVGPGRAVGVRERRQVAVQRRQRDAADEQVGRAVARPSPPVADSNPVLSLQLHREGLARGGESPHVADGNRRRRRRPRSSAPTPPQSPAPPPPSHRSSAVALCRSCRSRSP